MLGLALANPKPPRSSNQLLRCCAQRGARLRDWDSSRNGRGDYTDRASDCLLEGLCSMCLAVEAQSHEDRGSILSFLPTVLSQLRRGLQVRPHAVDTHVSKGWSRSKSFQLISMV